MRIAPPWRRMETTEAWTRDEHETMSYCRVGVVRWSRTSQNEK